MIGNDAAAADADAAAADEILSWAQHLPEGAEEAISEEFLLRVVFLADEVSAACEHEQEGEEEDHHLLTISSLDFLEPDRHNVTILSKPRSQEPIGPLSSA